MKTFKLHNRTALNMFDRNNKNVAKNRMEKYDKFKKE